MPSWGPQQSPMSKAVPQIQLQLVGTGWRGLAALWQQLVKDPCGPAGVLYRADKGPLPLWPGAGDSEISRSCILSGGSLSLL